MGLYRKKPVVIEAVQFDGSSTGFSEVKHWMKTGKIIRSEIRTQDLGRILYIETLEGTMAANGGDWIIKGVKDEFYACKPDIFEMTYEPVPDHIQHAAETRVEGMREPIPDYGDMIPIDEWNEDVKNGSFIPYDGTGYFATTEYLDRTCDAFGEAPEWATHVCWFNR